MRMAKAPKEHVDILRVYLQFCDELTQIDPENYNEWKEFKKDWEDDEEFNKIIKNCEDDEGRFLYEYYFDYYRSNISHIHMRVVLGYEILVDNVCDPDLDYLDFKPELKKLMEE